MTFDPSISISDDGYIEIRVHGGYVYDIGLDQIDRDHKSGRMNWVHHMRQKNWWNDQLDYAFINILKSKNLPLDAA